MIQIRKFNQAQQSVDVKDQHLINFIVEKAVYLNSYTLDVSSVSLL